MARSRIRVPIRFPSHAVRGGGALAAIASVLVASGCGASPAPAAPGRTTGPPASPVPTASTAGAAPDHLRARRLPVHLPAPLRDAVVFTDGPSLLVAGGLTAEDTSTAAVTRVDPGTGRASPAGRLATAVHDAAGIMLNGSDLVLGGGTSASVTTVQRLRPGASGRITGRLPEPRSDLVATTVGGAGYVLGGYTGGRMLPSVLRTTDGRTFHTVARLPVPVRYPALAAVGGDLWVMGGLTGDGHPTDAIQRVDVRSGTSTVAGHLPAPLSHAAGFVLGTRVYLAGGRDATGRPGDAILRVYPDGRTTRVGTLPMRLSDAGVAVTGEVAYLVGGEAARTVDTIVEIRPAGA